MRNSQATRLTILAIVATFTLTACGGSMVVAKELPPEVREKHETLLAQMHEKYANAQNDADKLDYTFEIGFQNMSLGNYGEAIKYYKMVLDKYDSVHLPSLTNLSVIYEELGDINKALKYQEQLLQNYPNSYEAVRDMMRLLATKGDFEKAESILVEIEQSTYTTNDSEFIKEQRAFLKREMDK